MGIEDLPGALGAAQAKLDLLKRCHLLSGAETLTEFFLADLGTPWYQICLQRIWRFGVFFWFFWWDFTIVIAVNQISTTSRMCGWSVKNSKIQFKIPTCCFRCLSFWRFPKPWAGKQMILNHTGQRSYSLCMMMKVKFNNLSLHDDTKRIMKFSDLCPRVNINVIFTVECQEWGGEIVKAAGRQILGRIQQEVQQYHVRNIVAGVKVVINIFISIAFWIQIQIKNHRSRSLKFQFVEFSTQERAHS